MARRSAPAPFRPVRSLALVLAGVLLAGCALQRPPEAEGGRAPADPAPAPSASPLPLPPEGRVPVAFVLGPDAEVLDFTGPLEVFAGAWTAAGQPAFQPYFVAAGLAPVTVGGGMKVVPDYTFATAPAPKVIVIPAMNGVTEERIDWIRRSARSAGWRGTRRSGPSSTGRATPSAPSPRRSSSTSTPR